MLIFLLLTFAAGIGSLICLILTLIKMFKNEDTLLAVLGIIFPIWAFIWGWINASKYQHKKVMLIWSAFFAVSLISGILPAFMNPGAL